MKGRYNRIVGFMAAIMVAGLFFLTGCAHQGRTPESSLDTPAHHVASGDVLLKDGRLDDAKREYAMALELDGKFSPAQRGLGLVLGRQAEFKNAFDAMAKAQRYSATPQEKAAAHVGFMQLYFWQQGSDWLSQVEAHSDLAVQAQKDSPAPHYYLGLAYQKAGKLDKAAQAFKEVLALNNGLVPEADQQLQKIQKTQRAQPGLAFARQLARQDKITRADAAALILDELNLGRIYGTAGACPKPLGAHPSDIKDHPLAIDIEAVLQLCVKGLEMYPDNTFKPEAPITRMNFALLLEDIYCKLKQDAGLGRQFIGSPSPFSDVRADAPYFNAVMLCTTRGLMEATNALNGLFAPHAPVSGADALLAIRKLKTQDK